MLTADLIFYGVWWAWRRGDNPCPYCLLWLSEREQPDCDCFFDWGRWAGQ